MNLGDFMITTRIFALVAAFVSLPALGFEGLVVSELPVGGDVTVPSEFPIQVPSKMDVRFSGVSTPQALVLANSTGTTSVVKIAAEKGIEARTIKLKPGTSAVYNFRSQNSVKLRVVSGDIRVSSLHPLKVQR
jgi:hypothetical protein